MDFMEMWSQVNDEQVNRIEAEFCFDMTMMIVLTWLLWLSLCYQKNCGIPVKEWLMGFEILYFSRSSFQLIKIQVLTNAYEWRTCYDIFAFCLCNGLMVGWIIYGFMIYYSEKNDCDRTTETAIFSSIMFVLLFLGYVCIFLYMMLLCVSPCATICLGDRPHRPLRLPAEHPDDIAQAEQVPAILVSLRKTQYDPNKFHSESACAICYVDYKMDDVVTQLKCDKRHYFHTECLEGWIKKGHNICPFCRAPIENYATSENNSSAAGTEHQHDDENEAEERRRLLRADNE